MTVRTMMAISLSACAIACGNTPAAEKPVTPLAPAAAAAAASTGRSEVNVSILDACDDSFNVLGDGTCIRNGGVSFDQFVAQLTRFGFAGAWRNAPAVANVQVGDTFVATNKGGETHTFTQVNDFGGGIVPFLNDLSHEPVVAPECAALEPDDFVKPGGTYRESVDKTGAVRFQCCIHPWMRFEASSR